MAFQIRQLERDTGGDFHLDAIVTVIDAENFTGYEDTSPTARMQASYSDIILIVTSFFLFAICSLVLKRKMTPQNKWELVSDRALDIVMDHLHTLNDITPKIKCQGRNGVDPKLIFGLQSKLFSPGSDLVPVVHDEVETLTLGREGIIRHDHGDHPAENNAPLERGTLIEALNLLPREAVWRLKGFVLLEDGKLYILNWAFGRYDLTEYSGENQRSLRMTVMGERGEVGRAVSKFVAALKS